MYAITMNSCFLCQLIWFYQGCLILAWEVKWWNRDVPSSSVCEFGECVITCIYDFLDLIFKAPYDCRVKVFLRFYEDFGRRMKRVNHHWMMFFFFYMKKKTLQKIQFSDDWNKHSWWKRERERVKIPANGARGEKKVCER